MADLFRNKASDYCLYMGNWIIDSLDLLKNVDSFSNKTPLCCSETQNSSAVALIGTIFISEIEQKQSILCLKCKSLNFNFLFLNYYCIKSHCNHVETFCLCNVAYLKHILYISFIYYKLNLLQRVLWNEGFRRVQLMDTSGPHDPLRWFFPWWRRLCVTSSLVPYNLQPFKALTPEGIRA